VEESKRKAAVPADAPPLPQEPEQTGQELEAERLSMVKRLDTGRISSAKEFTVDKNYTLGEEVDFEEFDKSPKTALNEKILEGN